MRTLLVDDEALARQRLERMLRSLQVEDITVATNADEALEAIKSQYFDVAFLDINMPGVNGIDLAYELRYNQDDLYIIFQTAYSEHALEAFDIGATGYLVKPYSLDALSKTLERTRQVASVPEEALRLLTKNGDEFYLLKPEDIFYIKADLSEVMIRSQKGFSYYARKISDLETLLKPYGFLRVHRSYLIHPDKIKRMETIEQSKIRFSFEGINDQIDSSKDGAKMFRDHFSGT